MEYKLVDVKDRVTKDHVAVTKDRLAMINNHNAMPKNYMTKHQKFLAFVYSELIRSSFVTFMTMGT